MILRAVSFQICGFAMRSRKPVAVREIGNTAMRVQSDRNATGTIQPA
jgi:hypothetical protein